MTRDRPDLAVVVLAAGLGTRFRSDRAKVLHPVAGRSLLWHVLRAVAPLGAGRVVTVVGHQAEEVAAEARASDCPDVTTVIQEERLGTGHATEVALGALDDGIERVLVLPGDTPLLRPETVARLADAHAEAEACLLSTELDDPTGYGRILHDDAGRVVSIVEEADATEAERGLREVNAGMYRFQVAALADALERVDSDNAQGERYLTDVVAVLVEDGAEVAALTAAADEVAGVNDRAQLAAAGAVLRDRELRALMRSGVTIVDPATTYLDVGVRVAADATLLPGCIIEGDTRVGPRATIGPWTRLVDAEVEDGASVAQSVVLGASIGPGCSVGPFAYLRPGTRLERGAKAGTFVEIKQTTVGEGSKVPHLSYLGDTTVGRDVNVGAGTIAANYDGRDKHRTDIGDGAFIGSGTTLMAPLSVGDGAYVAGGSAITDDVPDDALAVARSRQQNKEGWAKRRREERGDDAPGDEDQDPE